jgi:hypothetical protein
MYSILLSKRHLSNIINQESIKNPLASDWHFLLVGAWFGIYLQLALPHTVCIKATSLSVLLQ